MAPAVRRRVLVYGRVQGVFFRNSVRERARAHDVRGWVRNRPDGSVEAVLEGDLDRVELVRRFCEAGPRRAQVQRVEVFDEVPRGLAGFSIC
jgi:acylphosphatase